MATTNVLLLYYITNTIRIQGGEIMLKKRRFLVRVDSLDWADFDTLREAKAFIRYRLSAFFTSAIIIDRENGMKMYEMITITKLDRRNEL